MADGFKETEIAKLLGRTPSWVSERLSELRTEILLQNSQLPPLTDAEYASLKQSLQTFGQWHPIIVNADLKLIDGAHRLRACDELGIPAKYLPVTGLTVDEEWELAVALNAARRSLTRQQKRKLIEHELMRDPHRSDRRIAAVCGVHHETVAATRAEIAAAGEQWVASALPDTDRPADPGNAPETDTTVVATTATVAQKSTATVAPATRIDARGARQPARKPPRPPVDRVTAQTACPCCGRLVNVIRHGSDTRLEHTAEAAA